MAKKKPQQTNANQFDISQSAEAAALQALAEQSEQVDIMLTHVLGVVSCAIQDVSHEQIVQLEKVCRKIKSAITRKWTKLDDAITKVVTPISVTLYDQFTAMDWQLKQVLIKIGVLQPNQEVTPNVLETKERLVDPSFVGTVRLDLGPLAQCLCAIVEVLKEIRDRLPGVPVENPGETPAKELPYEWQSVKGVDLGSDDNATFDSLITTIVK